MASLLSGTIRHLLAPFGSMDAKILVREKVTRVDPYRITLAVKEAWKLADEQVPATHIKLPDWTIETIEVGDGPVVEVISAVVNGRQLIDQETVKTGNHDRDQWMLDRWNEGSTYVWIRINLPAKYGRLKTKQAVGQAIKKHAERHELDRRKGRKGRPKKST